VNFLFIYSLINSDCQSDNYKTLGYPNDSRFGAYIMSKIGVTALTRVHQREIDKDSSRSGIVISAACPGYCKTGMTKNGGFFTAENGMNFSLLI
jgi:NAD(P)-dependent dehydrogenase (short-subunit alcohol dehydrogenase family)